MLYAKRIKAQQPDAGFDDVAKTVVAEAVDEEATEPTAGKSWFAKGWFKSAPPSTGEGKAAKSVDADPEDPLVSPPASPRASVIPLPPKV